MNLNSSIDFNLKQFFHWWWRELSFWIPEKTRQALSEKSGYIYLSIKADKLQISRVIDGQENVLTELDVNEELAEQYQQFIAKNSLIEQAHLVLTLNSDQAIKKSLYLPAATKDNLQQVIHFEMDKYTPFKTDQVYFSIKPQGKKENGQINVLLILTPKEILDELYQILQKAQIYPAIVEYNKAANNFVEDLDSYNLLPEQDRPKKDRATQLIMGVAGFVVLLLLTMVLVFPVWHKGRTVESLRQQLKQLEKDTRIVQARQLEVDNIVDETNSLIEIKKNIPSLTKLIDALSQLIKQDTWLTHFKYTDGHLQIQGQSPVASGLIGILEAAPLFSNARFVSPLTQDKKTGLERFQISVDVNVKGSDNG